MLMNILAKNGFPSPSGDYLIQHFNQEGYYHDSIKSNISVATRGLFNLTYVPIQQMLSKLKLPLTTEI